jgi:hypothetical protein
MHFPIDIFGSVAINCPLEFNADHPAFALFSEALT